MPKLQEYPAEGAREIINRELARTSSAPPAAAGRGDIEHLFGELNPATIAEILALRPTPSELEETSAWLAGDGDVPAQEGHPLMGKTATIVDLIQRDSDERD